MQLPARAAGLLVQLLELGVGLVLPAGEGLPHALHDLGPDPRHALEDGEGLAGLTSSKATRGGLGVCQLDRVLPGGLRQPAQQGAAQP